MGWHAAALRTGLDQVRWPYHLVTGVLIESFPS